MAAAQDKLSIPDLLRQYLISALTSGNTGSTIFVTNTQAGMAAGVLPVAEQSPVPQYALTNTQMRATPVAVSGSIAVSNFPATVEVSNDVGNPLPVSGIVAVSNPTANPETGLAKDATLIQVRDRISPDVTVTGTLNGVGQTLVLAVPDQKSSFTVQPHSSTAFVASFIIEESANGGVDWVAVNNRASNGGRLANNFNNTRLVNSTGLFRGVTGGVSHIRLRCTAYTSGTLTATIRVGGPAAVFSNSDLVVQQQAQYYASSAGLNSMYGATSDINTFTLAPSDLAFFALYNPASSTVPLYVYRISLGAGSTGVFRRKRFTGVPSGGTAVAADNRAGTGTTPMAGAWKSSTGLTLPGTPVLQKTLNIATNAQDTSTEDFCLIVPVGQGLAFTYTGSNANATATAEIVWSEGSALT